MINELHVRKRKLKCHAKAWACAALLKKLSLLAPFSSPEAALLLVSTKNHDIPFMEVTGTKDIHYGARSLLKMTTGFGLFSSLSKVKIYFFLHFTSNLSYFNSFNRPYKIRLPDFRSPLSNISNTKALSIQTKVLNFRKWFKWYRNFNILQNPKIAKSPQFDPNQNLMEIK